MLQIHPNARTTPAVRAEIARSDEPTGVLARRYGVSTETVRKWRKRGPDDCLDHSARPHRLPWKATEEERAVICALRRSTNFALDDLTFVVAHFLPHLNRDSVGRILRAEGLSRRPPPSAGPRRGQGRFKEYDLGFVHIDIKHLPKLRIDIKHLPKLRTADGERRKRYLYVAIDRRSRSVHLGARPGNRSRLRWGRDSLRGCRRPSAPGTWTRVGCCRLRSTTWCRPGTSRTSSATPCARRSTSP